MSDILKEFYNEELETTDWYREVWKIETVQVREIKDLIVLHHYWRDADGELWSDFNNSMENPQSDFIAYRTRKDYLKPTEIKVLQTESGLTVHALASYLGMGSSTLFQLENNRRVQTKEQDLLLRMVNNYFHENNCLPQLKQLDFDK